MLTSTARAISRMRSRGEDAEAGFTLVELLVVIIIMGIIGTIVSASIISSLQSTRREQERVFTISLAQTALERLSKDVRVADPIVAANLNDISVLVYRNGHCELRRYWVDSNNQLNSSLARYTAASTSCATRTGGTDPQIVQMIMPNAGVDSKTLIFRYWSVNNNSALTELTPPVDPSMLSHIDRVELTIKGLLHENGSPVLLTSSIDLRNVEQLP